MVAKEINLIPRTNKTIVIYLKDAEVSFKEMIRLERIISGYKAILEEFSSSKIVITIYGTHGRIQQVFDLYHDLTNFFFRKRKQNVFSIIKMQDYMVEIQKSAKYKTEAIEETKDIMFLASIYNAYYSEIDTEKAIIVCPNQFAHINLFTDISKYCIPLCK